MGTSELITGSELHAPGFPSYVSFSSSINSFLVDFFKLNDRREIAFTSEVYTYGCGVWAGAPNALALVAFQGNQAPGMPAGMAFSSQRGTSPFSAPQLNSNGQVAFHATTTNGFSSQQGIWLGSAGNLQLVMKSGDPAPGLPPGTTIASLVTGGGHSTADFGFNNAGQLAFYSTLAGPGVTTATNSAIWRGTTGAFVLVARKGDAAPGLAPGTVYGDFAVESPVINAAGQTLFASRVVGTDVTTANDSALWVGTPGNVTLVAREGDQAPGALDGAMFGPLSDSLGFLGPAINAPGQVAFLNSLSDGSTGIFATDLLGHLTTIARTGDPLEVAPGDFRTVSALGFSGSTGNEDGRPSGFNDLGQVAFWAQFTDGSTGIFISNAVASVPEPATIALAASGLVGLVVRRGRKRERG